MGDGEGETKKTHRRQKVRFNSACNETHVLEREVSSASSSSDMSSSESTITDNDVASSDMISLDMSSSPQSSGAGYDPNRIPASVFNSAPGNDWSVASNDSLFSITMGNNNSFSRDQGGLLYKSGELMKLDEVFNLPITLPPVAEGESGVGVKDEEEEEEDDNCSSKKKKKKVDDLDAKGIKFEEHCKPKLGGGGDDLKNSARVSDGSAASNSSFAFPILISQDTKNVSSKSERALKQEHTTVSRPQQQSPKQLERKKSSPPPPPPPPPPKTRTLTSWFCCFSCCSFRCSMSLK